MKNVVFTQLSIPEVRKLFKEELESYFSDNPIDTSGNEETKDGFINKQEAADLLSCSVSTIDNYRRDKKLKRYQLGSAVRFKRSEVLELLEKKERA